VAVHFRQRSNMKPVVIINCLGDAADDPKTDVWQEIKPGKAIPPHNSWIGWMQMGYDSDHDCFIGKAREKCYALRYEPNQ
jgi:hypothetical protein